MLSILPSDILLIIVKHDLEVSDILALGSTCRALHRLIHTRELWTAVARHLSIRRPMALSPFTSLQEVELISLMHIVTRTMRVEKHLGAASRESRWIAQISSIPSSVSFSMCLPGGRYIILAFEGGDIIWWDTKRNSAVARHQTDGGINLMRCIGVDEQQHEFVLGMVFSRAETCEPSGHLMRLSAIRFVLPRAPKQEPLIIEYPSYPLSLPVTGIFVQRDFVGLVGLFESSRTVALVLLNRQTGGVTCIDTTIAMLSPGPGSYLDAASTSTEIILYRETVESASSYHYSIHGLVNLVRNMRPDKTVSSSRDCPEAIVYPPQSENTSLFSGIKHAMSLHSFEIKTVWNREGCLSCLSTCYEIDITTKEQVKTINHHYFESSSPPSYITRTFRHQLRSDEQIHVNERGVELIVLGSHGRHAAWVVDSSAGPTLQVATFPCSYAGDSVGHVQTLNLDGAPLCLVDSLELEDAQGILFITTPKELFKYDFGHPRKYPSSATNAL